MKTVYTLLLSGLLFILYSCSQQQEQKKVEEEEEITNPFQPFKLMVVQHPVSDFESWKIAYESHDSIRKAYGVNSFMIGRGLEDSNMVTLIMRMDDTEKAKEFSTLPELKKSMERAGVMGKPTFHYIDIVRNDESKIDNNDRVMVIHKVKDFPAWLKFFDSEGTAARKANGLIDRGIGRDMDDANMVYLVFAISDMNKAKARMNSEELKKLMADAGVEGPPVVNFYRVNN